MVDYDADLIVSILRNRHEIEAFLESTTASLMPFGYRVEAAEKDAFIWQEGHTLWNLAARTTRVPNAGGFRESLIIMVSDIDRARKSVLSAEEDRDLITWASRTSPPVSEAVKTNSAVALWKLTGFLNGDEFL